MTAYKKQLAYENTPVYTEMFYKEPGLYAGQCISSTNLLDMAKGYAKKNYLTSNFTMTMFGTQTKALFTDYVKKVMVLNMTLETYQQLNLRNIYTRRIRIIIYMLIT